MESMYNSFTSCSSGHVACRLGCRFLDHATAEDVGKRLFPRRQSASVVCHWFLDHRGRHQFRAIRGRGGYAYKLGIPVANWEWLVFPALTILLWVFVPLYVRNNNQHDAGVSRRTLWQPSKNALRLFTVASYVFVNFALVFYTGGFALSEMWHINKIAAVWLLAFLRDCTPSMAGLEAMAWTSSLQCILLMGGGIYVFFSGMSYIHWTSPP